MSKREVEARGSGFFRSRTAQVMLAVLFCGAMAGLAVTVSIVRDEGWEGLWARKKQFIQATAPGSEPALKKADEALGIREPR